MSEFPCSGPITAVLRVASGDLRIVAEPRTTVDVDVQPGSHGEAARTAAANTRVEMNGDDLLVEMPQARGFVIRRTPPLEHHRAGAARQQPHPPVRVRRPDLPRPVRRDVGPQRVSATCGSITSPATSIGTRPAATRYVTMVEGNATLVHASGDMESVRWAVTSRAKSASGDIDVEAVGGSARVSTASGDIKLRDRRSGSTRVHAASGDVHIGVAEGTAVWLDLNSACGDTRSELAVSDETPAGTDLNLRLQVRTASGDITVRRSAGRPVVPVRPGTLRAAIL